MARIVLLRTSPSQIEETAKAIWEAMLEQARHKKLPRNITKYGAGYYMTGSIAEYARACWPGTNFKKGSGKTAMNMVRQFLRSTGNVVPIAPGAREIFVRESWAYRDSIPVLVGVPTARRERLESIQAAESEHRRKEAKVTPKEAGETLPPAPVEIRKGEIMSHPEYGKGTLDTNYPSMLRFSNGMVQCTDCGKTLKPQGMGPHAKMHADAARDARLVELEALAEANLGNLDTSKALGLVTSYIHKIETDRAKLQVALAQATAKPAGNPDCEAQLALIREVLIRAQKGEVSMIRALSDINDAMAMNT